MKVYPNSDLAEIADTAHPIFKVVEKEFNDWFEAAPSWHTEAYEEQDDNGPMCSKKGAIEDAIEGMINEADGEGKPVDISKYDLIQHFQP